jgi:hypothetical protein
MEVRPRGASAFNIEHSAFNIPVPPSYQAQSQSAPIPRIPALPENPTPEIATPGTLFSAT